MVDIQSLPEAVPTGETDQIMNPDCEETVWFHMSVGDNEFRMGLGNMLECLMFAEDCGFIPNLPWDWWSKLPESYGLSDLRLSLEEQKGNKDEKI